MNRIVSGYNTQMQWLSNCNRTSIIRNLNNRITVRRGCSSNWTSGETKPVWFNKSEPSKIIPTFNRLKENTEADVVVVGGGIAGLTSAYCLLESGKSVALIEAREIASGETGRTTAHLAWGVDDRYYNLLEHHGLEGAKIMYKAHSKAVDKIEEIVNKEKIDCEFERVNGYLFLGVGHKPDLLKKEMDACNKIGITSVKMVDKVPIPNIDSPALLFPDQAQYDPIKYMAGLTNAVKKKGGKIYTHTRAVSMKGESFYNSEVVTDSGNKLTSNFLIVSTNVPVNDRITMYSKLEPYRTYVIAFKIPKGSLERALYWDTLDPYHYIRLSDCDDKYDYLIIGGEDEKVGQSKDYQSPYMKLEHWSRERFPMIESIANQWSGQVIEPIDHVAYIGHNPRDTANVLIVTGDSGNGLTHGTIAGMMFTKIVHKQHSNWESLFSPSRNPPMKDATHFISHNLEVNSQYKDWVTGSEYKSIDDIPIGEGGVMRDGFSKVAIYKDESGSVHKMSAVCPHLHGILHWNNAEKSWDCPVHGSRFDKYGKVVNGPSNCDLKCYDSPKSSDNDSSKSIDDYQQHKYTTSSTSTRRPSTSA